VSAVAPVVAVGGIAFDDDGRVLLIQRARPPAAGLWSIPGGKLHLGESLVDACAREVREETGLDVEVGALVTVVERVIRDDAGEIAYHFVIHDYLVRVRGGRLTASDDAADARWVGPEELAALPLTDGLDAVLDNAREMG